MQGIKQKCVDNNIRSGGRMKDYKIINGVKWYDVSNSCIKTMEYPDLMPEEEYKTQVKLYQEFEFKGGKEEFLKPSK